MVSHIIRICNTDFEFEDFSEVSGYFKDIINAFKQMNYSEYKGEDFYKFEQRVADLVAQRAK